MESAWSNGKPAYRCRHGRLSATVPDPDRPKNTYVREDKLLPHLPALPRPGYLQLRALDIAIC
jgi:site-specific DNA recombinase